MSVETVRNYFEKYGMADRVLEFELSSETVELAAKAAGTEPCRIAKTMSFMVDDAPILILLAGDVKVDNRKFKDTFHTKAKMLTGDQLVELVGHPHGGVCPFAIKEDVKVYLDESLKRFETVFPACGNASSAIEVSLEELERFAAPQGWVDVCRIPEA